LKQGDRVMVPKYSTTPAGSIMGNFSTFISGGVVVYPSEEYSVATTLSLLSKEKCTTLFTEPQDLDDLLNHADFSKNSYEDLKNVVVCAPLGFDSTTVLALLKQKLPQLSNTLVVNGLEETSGILTINGKLVDNTEIKIVDGTLQVKGPLVAKGRWQDIGQVGFETNEDGWVNTKYQKAKIEGDQLSL
jgi:acyl-CoA synthetase (AMP-forming)/AMP-acid ligase II